MVADGMGALAGGARRPAALQCCRARSRGVAGSATYDAMKTTLEHINGDVYRQIDNNGVMGMAGTTLCAAVAKERQLSLFWSGTAGLICGGTAS